MFCHCLTALLDPPGRFRFHQIGQPLIPRYLWPLEQVFQPPLLALGIRFPWLECSSFRPFVDAPLIIRRPFAVVRNRFPLENVKIASNTAQLLDIPPKQSSPQKPVSGKSYSKRGNSSEPGRPVCDTGRLRLPARAEFSPVAKRPIAVAANCLRIIRTYVN